MARPAEKARAMLNKWTAMRNADDRSGPGRSGDRGRRPHLASDCEYLADAERYRNQIVREIEQGVSKIQNPAMGEHAIRELNDEINHKVREKWHWNRRIVELGGPNYNEIERQRRIEEGDTQLKSGYRYFGAARDLPGVKELLAKEAEKLQKKRGKSDVHKNITPDYYGWRDEEDGVLLEIEAEADGAANDRLLEEEKKKKRRRTSSGVVGSDTDLDDDDSDDDDYLGDVPTQEEIGRILLEHKKKALLDKYAL